MVFDWLISGYPYLFVSLLSLVVDDTLILFFMILFEEHFWLSVIL